MDHPQQNEVLVSDAQWESIRPLVNHSPRRVRVGRRPLDERLVLEAFLWVVRHRARWQDLPPSYPSPRTCQRRLQEWRASGLWPRIWLAFVGAMDEQSRAQWRAVFDRPLSSGNHTSRVGRPPWWRSLANDFRKVLIEMSESDSSGDSSTDHSDRTKPDPRMPNSFSTYRTSFASTSRSDGARE
jgi:transposase